MNGPLSLQRGWHASKQVGNFFLVKRGLESAVVHRHDSRTGSAHFCEWVGDVAKCQNCGTTVVVAS